MKSLNLPQKSRHNAGFTLLELAIVLCVIGILSAILVPSVTDIVKQAEKTASLQNCRTYYDQLAFYSIEEDGLAIEDYFYVSGDYVYVVEKGALQESDEYAMEDGELVLKEDGSTAEDLAPVELPKRLLRDVVTVYEKIDLSEAPYDEAAQQAAYEACNDVKRNSSLYVSLPRGSVFVYGNFAYDFDGITLTLSEKTARNGVLINAESYGLREFDFSGCGYEPGDVKVYVPAEWQVQMV